MPLHQKARVVIWECEGTPFGPTRYGTLLQEKLVAGGFDAKVIPYLGDDLDPDAYAELKTDAHIWTGGSIDSADSSMSGWKGLLSDQIARSNRGGPLVFGICLGAQLIADAYAGRHVVREAPRGLEIGAQRVSPVAPPPPADSVSRDGLTVCQFHYHEIAPSFLDLDGVQHLMTNSHSVVQAFQIGERTFGYQFHPEFNSQDCRRLIDENQSLISSFDGRKSEFDVNQEVDADSFDKSVLSRLRSLIRSN